jgi:hypothetical protein
MLLSKILLITSGEEDQIEEFHKIQRGHDLAEKVKI